MSDNSLFVIFFLVFLGQILFISLYITRRLLARANRVLDTYPPSKFPKLYPKPYDTVEVSKKRLRILRIMNYFVIFIGLILLERFVSYVLNGGEWRDGVVESFILAPYTLVQFIPFVVLAHWSGKTFKLMRKAALHRTRKAELRPRRLFDFISPAELGMAIFVYLAFVLFVIYIQQNPFPAFAGYINIAFVTFANLILAGVVVSKLYGKKIDPYMAHKNRIMEMKNTVKIMVYLSIAGTAFISISLVISSMELSDNQSVIENIFQSLYFQLVALLPLILFQIPLDDIDFDVYKEDSLSSLQAFDSHQ